MAKYTTLGPKKKGQKPIKFVTGGLHKSLGVPVGEKIPAAKMQSALAGKAGKKALKQAQFAKNVLRQGRKTAMQNKKEAAIKRMKGSKSRY